MAEHSIAQQNTAQLTDPLRLVVHIQSYGSVCCQLTDTVRQLAAHPLQRIVVCLVARVTGIYFHRRETQLPASRCCLNNNPTSFVCKICRSTAYLGMHNAVIQLAGVMMESINYCYQEGLYTSWCLDATALLSMCCKYYSMAKRLPHVAQWSNDQAVHALPSALHLCGSYATSK